MTDIQVTSAVTYLYLKSELEKIKKSNDLTERQVNYIENSLKEKLGINSDLCWI